jgi:hypothetical protein
MLIIGKPVLSEGLSPLCKKLSQKIVLPSRGKVLLSLTLGAQSAHNTALNNL